MDMYIISCCQASGRPFDEFRRCLMTGVMNAQVISSHVAWRIAYARCDFFVNMRQRGTASAWSRQLHHRERRRAWYRHAPGVSQSARRIARFSGDDYFTPPMRIAIYFGHNARHTLTERHY